MTSATPTTDDLLSETAEIRLRAARHFEKAALPEHALALRKAIGIEKVRWIKKALERALDRAEKRVSKPIVSAQVLEPDDEMVRALRAQAIEDVATTMLHEFGPVLGSIRLSAPDDIQDYEASRTKRSIEKLHALLRAVRKLKKTVSVPTYSQFDLSDLVSEVIASQDESLIGISIESAGQSPFVVTADKDSLTIALSNGIKNAVEAVREFSSINPPKIVINWGAAGPQVYLVVIDTGAGFVGNPSDALKLGVTNKKDHFGHGLAMAAHAMESMEGEIAVSNNVGGGARFELRWMKDNENSFN